VGYSPALGSVLAVFRGTKEKSLKNWIHNLMTTRTQIEYPGGSLPADARVHDGFYRSWTRSVLQKQTTDAIQAIFKARGAVLPVVVIGRAVQVDPGLTALDSCALKLKDHSGLSAFKFFFQFQLAPPHIGHSLGGALATLCAAELVTEYNLTAVRLYTFGCPRVGNRPFAIALRNTTLLDTRRGGAAT